MRKYGWIVGLLLPLILVGVGINIRGKENIKVENGIKNDVSPTEVAAPAPLLIEPISQFKQRITKKHFGTYVTPKNSPVSPERFTGYHNASDAEYEDVMEEVPVWAIADGEIIYSGYVNGYGGFEAIKFKYQGNTYIAVYGHLKPESLLKKGMIVIKGDKIGILGKGYSSETDGERKHLHFGIIKGDKLDFRGYVQKPEELDRWENPEKML